MKLSKPSNALVIVGGWNRHIFTQDWIKRYLFPKEEFTIDMLVSQGFNAQFISPRISSKEVEILFQENRLNFNPVENNNENLDRIQELALQLADYLPHTPVTGYGVNFLFTENEVSDDLINLMRPKDLEKIEQFGGSLTSEQYSRHLMLNGRTLNITIRFEGESVDFDFNFHFNIRDLVAFKAGILETPILKLRQEAVKFIAKVYSLELEGESE
ncbi:MAG: hypothetical protein OXU27_06075 [Candidatus Poribacteria bacterium]|nr:hypothetical protein [Candidatus Poribacteria bacterium]MDD9973553.1 hypothetical protein [Candidatus Poribacteria bacterium]MDE0322284.1 hypothetical protein [Candidatus Poribacteria bacterium]